MRSAIDAFVGKLGDIYEQELVSVWMGGSRARDCGTPAASDVDLLLVTKGLTALGKRGRILELTKQQSLPYDIAVATIDHINVDVFPTPVDFFLKMNNTIVLKSDGSKDFLLLRQDISESGRDLLGTPHKQSLKRVPWPLVQQCIRHVVPQIRTHFKNPALMFCRVAFTLAERRLCTKIEAGEWGLRALDARFHRLIQMDLDSYVHSNDCSLDQDDLRHLEAHCKIVIEHCYDT